MQSFRSYKNNCNKTAPHSFAVGSNPFAFSSFFFLTDSFPISQMAAGARCHAMCSRRWRSVTVSGYRPVAPPTGDPWSAATRRKSAWIIERRDRSRHIAWRTRIFFEVKQSSDSPIFFLRDKYWGLRRKLLFTMFTNKKKIVILINI